jgi:hypothetical protein
MSKMIFKKLKKYHWHAFQHEKLFEKQLLSHCQIYIYVTHTKEINMQDRGS